MSAELVIFVPRQPAAVLSPNGRSHWSAKAEAVQTARWAAKLATCDALSREPVAFPAEGDVAVELVIHWGKGRRFLDDDNALSVLKPYLDGVADALDRDDRTFRLQIPEQVRAQGPPGVFVSLSAPAPSVSSADTEDAGA